ncbi:MAG: hypothetical protein EXR25_07195 [Limnohabitans sp.]|nr:hypothetical protein [Limnohabitans sp.]
MTIALFGISSIYNGIQKFMSATAQLERTAPFVQTPNTGNSPKTHMLAKQRALRVLRVSEHGETPHCAGRMVISGRMSDVCAELDRLVALEAQKKPTLTH